MGFQHPFLRLLQCVLRRNAPTTSNPSFQPNPEASQSIEQIPHQIPFAFPFLQLPCEIWPLVFDHLCQGSAQETDVRGMTRTNFLLMHPGVYKHCAPTFYRRAVVSIKLSDALFGSAYEILHGRMSELCLQNIRHYILQEDIDFGGQPERMVFEFHQALLRRPVMQAIFEKLEIFEIRMRLHYCFRNDQEDYRCKLGEHVGSRHGSKANCNDWWSVLRDPQRELDDPRFKAEPSLKSTSDLEDGKSEIDMVLRKGIEPPAMWKHVQLDDWGVALIRKKESSSHTDPPSTICTEGCFSAFETSLLE